MVIKQFKKIGQAKTLISVPDNLSQFFIRAKIKTFFILPGFFLSDSDTQAEMIRSESPEKRLFATFFSILAPKFKISDDKIAKTKNLAKQTFFAAV